MYVYIKSEPRLWTVGFYSPDGRFEPESDFGTTAEAVERVHYLNGGSVARPTDEELLAALRGARIDTDSDGMWLQLQMGNHTGRFQLSTIQCGATLPSGVWSMWEAARRAVVETLEEGGN